MCTCRQFSSVQCSSVPLFKVQCRSVRYYAALPSMGFAITTYACALTTVVTAFLARGGGHTRAVWDQNEKIRKAREKKTNRERKQACCSIVVVFSSVLFSPISATLDARGHLAWTLLGIIFFLRSLHYKGEVIGFRLFRATELYYKGEVIGFRLFRATGLAFIFNGACFHIQSSVQYCCGVLCSDGCFTWFCEVRLLACRETPV